MERKKLKISIGIPAYNEEANIRFLLDALAHQKIGDYELLETIVISDGSTDRTVSEANASILPNLSVIARQDRLGPAKRQNELLDVFRGDILLLMNADVLPADEHLLSRIAEQFLADPAVGMVGVKHIPVPALGFFERVINASVFMKIDLFERFRDGDNLYTCRGGARAYSRSFAHLFKWNVTISEDVYSYLECKRLGFRYKYAREAAILYRSPSNITDHLRQSIRYNQGMRYLKAGIRDHAESAIPLGLLCATAITHWLKNPALLSAFLVVYVLALVATQVFKADLVQYNTAHSSKRLRVDTENVKNI